MENIMKNIVVLSLSEYESLITYKTQLAMLINAIQETSLLPFDGERLTIDSYEMERALHYSAPEVYKQIARNLRSKGDLKDE